MHGLDGDTGHALGRVDRKLVGFGLCHTTPLVEGRIRDETRVLKLVLARGSLLREAVTALADFARRHGTRRAAFRVQTEYLEKTTRFVERRGADEASTKLLDEWRLALDALRDGDPHGGAHRSGRSPALS